jgi:hypothetical protein
MKSIKIEMCNKPIYPLAGSFRIHNIILPRLVSRLYSFMLQAEMDIQNLKTERNKDEIDCTGNGNI